MSSLVDTFEQTIKELTAAQSRVAELERQAEGIAKTLEGVAVGLRGSNLALVGLDESIALTIAGLVAEFKANRETISKLRYELEIINGAKDVVEALLKETA